MDGKMRVLLVSIVSSGEENLLLIVGAESDEEILEAYTADPNHPPREITLKELPLDEHDAEMLQGAFLMNLDFQHTITRVIKSAIAFKKELSTKN